MTSGRQTTPDLCASCNVGEHSSCVPPCGCTSSNHEAVVGREASLDHHCGGDHDRCHRKDEGRVATCLYGRDPKDCPACQEAGAIHAGREATDVVPHGEPGHDCTFAERLAQRMKEDEALMERIEALDHGLPDSQDRHAGRVPAGRRCARLRVRVWCPPGPLPRAGRAGRAVTAT